MNMIWEKNNTSLRFFKKQRETDMKKNPYQGKFILLEGIDGSGKTTQARLLDERLKKENIPSFLTREPTSDNIFGKLARFIYTCESLHDKISAELDQCMQGAEYQTLRAMYDDLQMKHVSRFEAIAREIISGNYNNLPMFLQLTMILDRYHHHVDAVIPNLERGMHVVADRDFFSTLAYSASDDIAWQPLLLAHEEILGDTFLMPDLLFIIDVPVEIGIARTMTKQQGKKDYFDTKEKLTKIRKRYFELSQRPEIVKHISGLVINASDASPEVVHELIWSYAHLLVGSTHP